MKPEVAMDHTVVAIHHQDEVVNVMVDIEAPPAPETDRPPVDIVMVIDRSGSMSGTPLREVTKAVADVIRKADPKDRVAVVSFDDDADLVLPLDSRHGPDAIRRVRGIHSGGSTNLSGGWLKALEVLASSPRPEAVRRIIVLTDGHANAGVCEGEALAEMITGGHVHDISTSFIGFADGFDEEMLEKLADAGQGNNYFCEGADQAAPVFMTEFNGLAAVVAQNISVDVLPGSPVAVVGVLNDFATTPLPDGGVQVKIGDAYGGEVRRVVVALHLRPQATLGDLDIAKIVLRWTSVGDAVEMHTVTIPVKITVGAPGTHDAGADPRVSEEIIVLEAARDQREARRLANNGEFESAANLIRQAVVRLQHIPGQTAQANRLRQYADQLVECEWDAGTSKAFLMSSKMMSRKRTTMVWDLDDDDDSTGL